MAEPLDEGVEHTLDLVDLGIEIAMVLFGQVPEIMSEEQLVLGLAG